MLAKEKGNQMNKQLFIVIIIGLHISFILLQIHKQSYVMQLSYQKQKKEKFKQELIEKKNTLTQQLQIVHNRSTIKKFAEKNLGMKKISLNQIKQMPHEHST
jgi:hypothetical protein